MTGSADFRELVCRFIFTFDNETYQKLFNTNHTITTSLLIDAMVAKLLRCGWKLERSYIDE